MMAEFSHGSHSHTTNCNHGVLQMREIPVGPPNSDVVVRVWVCVACENAFNITPSLRNVL